MMQAQNILFMLGLIPTPDGRRVRPDIEGARLLIDQLAMIKEKTRGNLTADESSVLDQMLSRVRLTFVEVARSLGEDPRMDLSEALGAEETDFSTASTDKGTAGASASQQTPPAKVASTSGHSATITASATEPEESKKRFVKSYG